MKVALDLKGVSYIGDNPNAPWVLRAGSNPPPPRFLDDTALSDLIESKEFRYIVQSKGVLTCRNGRAIGLVHYPRGTIGWSKEAFPFNVHTPHLWATLRTHWEPGIEKEPPHSTFKFLEGSESCAVFGIEAFFRVGELGQVGLSFIQAFTTTFVTHGSPIPGRVPWFFSAVGAVKLCCDGSYEAGAACSSFPHFAFYIENDKVETHDPFAIGGNVWLGVMSRWALYRAGGDVYDSLGSVMRYRGNVITGEGPFKV